MDELTEAMKSALAGTLTEKQDDVRECIAMTICDSTFGSLDSAGLTKSAPSVLMFSTVLNVKAIYDMADKDYITYNPLLLNIAGDKASPITLDYLRKRVGLNTMSSGVAMAGAAASVVTVTDVGSIGQHGNAIASSGAHVVKLKAIGDRYKADKIVQAWIDVILACKARKTGLRSGQLVLGATLGGLGAILGSVALTAIKAGLGVQYSTICRRVAMDLHYRAYIESTVAGKIDKPATEILQELFTRRGVTRIFGQHNIKGMILEPGGWEAVADKLTLI